MPPQPSNQTRTQAVHWTTERLFVDGSLLTFLILFFNVNTACAHQCDFDYLYYTLAVIRFKRECFQFYMNLRIVEGELWILQYYHGFYLVHFFFSFSDGFPTFSQYCEQTQPGSVPCSLSDALRLGLINYMLT